MMMVGYSTINSWPHLLQPLSDPHVLQIAKAKGRTASQVGFGIAISPWKHQLK